MHFCSLSSNWSVASRIKPHVIQWYVTLKLFPTVYRRIYCRKFLTLSNQTSRYKLKCIRMWHLFVKSTAICPFASLLVAEKRQDEENKSQFKAKSIVWGKRSYGQESHRYICMRKDGIIHWSTLNISVVVSLYFINLLMPFPIFTQMANYRWWQKVYYGDKIYTHIQRKSTTYKAYYTFRTT